jgi:hypothetical protein
MSKKITATAADRKAFAHHLAEALRLARNPAIAPADLSNALGEAVNDHLTNQLSIDSESAEFIGFVLERIAARREGVGGEV